VKKNGLLIDFARNIPIPKEKLQLKIVILGLNMFFEKHLELKVKILVLNG